MLLRPGADRRPRRLLEAQLALLDEPAADRLVRLVVVRGEGHPHQLARPVVLVDEGKPPEPCTWSSSASSGSRSQAISLPASERRAAGSVSSCCRVQ
jgi:hypothetical protein